MFFLKNKYESYKESEDDEKELIGNTILINNLKKKVKQI